MRAAQMKHYSHEEQPSFQSKYDEGERGTGQTTKQMRDAPTGALFIWCNDKLDYPKHLAQKIGRTDLVITGPSQLERFIGKTWPDVIVDHAAWFKITRSQFDEVMRLQAYARRK